MTDRANAGTCNVPGCEHPARVRGLCATHYWRLMNGQDETARAEAEKYADPPKRGAPGSRGGKTARSGRATSKVAGKSETPLAKRASSIKPNGLAIIAALGGRIVPTSDGQMLLRDGQVVGHVAVDGTVRKAELQMGDIVVAEA